MEVLGHCGCEFRGQGNPAGKTAVVGEAGYTQAGEEGAGVFIADKSWYVENVGKKDIGGLWTYSAKPAELVPQLSAIVLANSRIIIIAAL